MPDLVLSAVVSPEETLTATLEADVELAADVTSPEAMAALLEVAPELVADLGLAQGFRGPPGPAGSAQLTRRTLGPISGGTVARLVGAAHCGRASAAEREHAFLPVGVALHAVSEMDGELAILLSGEVTDDTWSFAPGGAVFVDAGGRLTQARDSTWPYVRVIGVAITATRVWVDPQLPVFQGP